MAHRARVGILKEVCLVVALLASIGFGAIIGFFWEKFGQKEGVTMGDRMNNWFFAVLIVSVVVMQRMVDQVAGIYALTTYRVSIAPGIGIDTTVLPRGIYVPMEMVAALLVVCIMEFYLRRLRPDILAVGWIGSMFIFLTALGALRQLPIHVLGVIGVIAFISGIPWKNKDTKAILDGCEQGIVVGCLLGGSLRYGFALGVLMAALAWMVRVAGSTLGRWCMVRAR